MSDDYDPQPTVDRLKVGVKHLAHAEPAVAFGTGAVGLAEMLRRLSDGAKGQAAGIYRRLVGPADTAPPLPTPPPPPPSAGQDDPLAALLLQIRRRELGD